jgi:hypothetical protein
MYLLTYPRVQNGLEPLTLGAVCKYPSPESVPVKFASPVEDVLAEGPGDFRQCGFTGRDQGVGDFVGIDDRNAQPAEYGAGRRFAAADAARETDHQWSVGSRNGGVVWIQCRVS